MAHRGKPRLHDHMVPGSILPWAPSLVSPTVKLSPTLQGQKLPFANRDSYDCCWPQSHQSTQLGKLGPQVSPSSTYPEAGNAFGCPRIVWLRGMRSDTLSVISNPVRVGSTLGCQTIKSVIDTYWGSSSHWVLKPFHEWSGGHHLFRSLCPIF